MTTEEPTKHIGAAEAKARLSALLDGVQHRGERYVIERHGKPVAALVSLDEAGKLPVEGPTAERPLGPLALLGLWSELGDEFVDDFIERVYAAREEPGRSIELDPPTSP